MLLNPTEVRSTLNLFMELPKVEQQVFILHYCKGITSPSDIAQTLGWKSRGSAQTVQQRIAAKLGPLLPLLDPAPDLAPCQQCHKNRVLHKVKYADDVGCGSMMVCDPCDEQAKGWTI